MTSFIALLIAVPVSFGIALFLTELAPGWLKRPLGIAIELLAAIPSIVYGMWGLFIFAPLFATYFQEPVGNILSNIPFVGALFSGPAFGIGILAAGVILAIMIIPYIAAVMRDVFEQTPVMMKESAYGIGCTTWEVIWRIVLPFTKNGVIGGIMLGLGRALGETMAVTFIIGNTYQLDSASLYMPGNSITSAPSIVVGLFVYTIVVAQMQHFSGWAGVIALALLQVPIVIRTTENMLKLVPDSLREAAYALGTPKWKMISAITLKASISGIMTGILLAIARIAGETAPLLFTALSNQFWSTDMMQPIANLPVTIFKFAMSPFAEWQQLAWAGVLIITLCVLLLNILARVIFAKKKHG